jgi:hypothetical protein
MEGQMTAGQKAAQTRRDRIAQMSPQEKAWVTIRRKKAAKKAVETRKANERKRILSERAKKAWETRRKNQL